MTLAARDPDALIDRARTQVSRREWKEAVASYTEGFALGPTDDGELWFEYAAVQLLAGDRAGYRRACAHMLAHCQPKGSMRPYLVARACTLSPDSADDPDLPGRLSGHELMRSPTAFWSLTEQAALQLRRGQTANIVLLLDQSLVADGRLWPGDVELAVAGRSAYYTGAGMKSAERDCGWTRPPDGWTSKGTGCRATPRTWDCTAIPGSKLTCCGRRRKTC